MDSHYARSLFGRGLDEEFWLNAFEHYSVINISIEIFKALDSIKNSNLSRDKIQGIDSIAFNDSLDTYFKYLEGGIDDIPKTLYKMKQHFEIWLKILIHQHAQS